MNKFIVIKKIGEYRASEERSFTTKESAQMFLNLLRESEEKDFVKYYLCEVID